MPNHERRRSLLVSARAPSSGTPQVGRLRAGQHHDGDPDILIVVDAAYEVCRLAFLPVEVLGRIRSAVARP
jgi:hypothetical protein